MEMEKEMKEAMFNISNAHKLFSYNLSDLKVEAVFNNDMCIVMSCLEYECEYDYD